MRALLLALLLFSNTAEAQNQATTLHKILNIEDQRRGDDPLLAESLNSTSSKVVLAALRAIARIQDPKHITAVAGLLQHSNAVVRSAAATALGFLGGADAAKMLTEYLKTETNVQVRGSVALALGRIDDSTAKATLESLIVKEKDSPVLVSTAHGLGQYLVFSKAKKDLLPATIAQLTEFAKADGVLALESAFALSRVRENLENLNSKELIEAAQSAKTVGVLGYLIRTLSRVSDASVETLLIQLTQHKNRAVRVEAVGALEKKEPSSAVLEALKTALSDKFTQNQVRVLEALRTFGEKSNPVASAVAALYASTPSPWVKANALDTLSAVNSAQYAVLVKEALKAQHELVISKAVEILGRGLQTEVQVQEILSYTYHSSDMVKATALAALAHLPSDVSSDIVTTVLAKALSSKNEDIVATAANTIGELKLKSLAPFVEAELKRTGSVLVPLLDSLAIIGGPTQLPAITPLLDSPIKAVVESAAAAYKAISGVDMSAKIPLNSIVKEATPTRKEIKKALQNEFVFETTKGTFAFRTLPIASLTAVKIMRLVESGFYVDKSFHRVVPNFVVQGGAAEADGGMIRDEVSNRRHLRGTVGIATFGKDTGSTQFFVNQAPNLHLDGHYTVFAKLTSGADVIDHLEASDRIMRAYLKKLKP